MTAASLEDKEKKVFFENITDDDLTVVCETEQRGTFAKSLFVSPLLRCVTLLKANENFPQVMHVAFTTKDCGPDAIAFEQMFTKQIAAPAVNVCTHFQNRYSSFEVVSFIREQGLVAMKINTAQQAEKRLEFVRGETYRVLFRLSWQMINGRVCLIATLV